MQDRNVKVSSYSFGPKGITVKWEYGITAKPYPLKLKYRTNKTS